MSEHDVDPAKVLFSKVCKYLEFVGRGWKRQLADALDVPETTVQGWLKAERFPRFVENHLQLLVYKKYIEEIRAAARRRDWLDFVIEMPDGTYAFARKNGAADHLSLVASGFRRLEDAEAAARTRAMRALLEFDEFDPDGDTAPIHPFSPDGQDVRSWSGNMSVGSDFYELCNATADFKRKMAEPLARSVADMAGDDSLILNAVAELLGVPVSKLGGVMATWDLANE